MTHVVIIGDVAAFYASEYIQENLGKIQGRSGNHMQYSSDGTKAMFVITSLEGLSLEGLAFIDEITTYEEIYGYQQQQEINGVKQWNGPDPQGPPEKLLPILENIPAQGAKKAKYNLVYPRTPVVTEHGVHTPPKLFVVPGGWKSDHLL